MKHSIILKVLALIVCVYFFGSFISVWNTLNESEKELEAVKSEYAEKVNDIAELKMMLSDESNKQIIEKAARERLGYIYSNEHIFVDISGN